jgi:hypothetical protein
LPDGINVTGIGDHHRHGGELIEQVGHQAKLPEQPGIAGWITSS